jgi:nicotinate-nucleotide adenylyltransferase
MKKKIRFEILKLMLLFVYWFANFALAATTDFSASVSDTEPRPLRIGIFTGSFDPPHLGHKNIVDKLKAQFNLDEVYVVPDKATPYKPNMLPFPHRKSMTSILFKDDKSVKTLPSEIEKNIGSGEIWDVIEAVRQHHPEADLFSMMGTDTFKWYQGLPAEMRAKKITILVNSRDRSADIPTYLDSNSVYNVELHDAGVSSTGIRNELRAGRASTFLTDSLHDYIIENGLYGADKVTGQSIKCAVFYSAK